MNPGEGTRRGVVYAPPAPEHPGLARPSHYNPGCERTSLPRHPSPGPRRTMKAAFLETTGTPDVIRFGELPRPTPGRGEVLVKVGAASLIPIDLYIRAGTVAMP